jgi:hypothetical protein
LFPGVVALFAGIFFALRILSQGFFAASYQCLLFSIENTNSLPVLVLINDERTCSLHLGLKIYSMSNLVKGFNNYRTRMNNVFSVKTILLSNASETLIPTPM